MNSALVHCSEITYTFRRPLQTFPSEDSALSILRSLNETATGWMELCRTKSPYMVGQVDVNIKCKLCRKFEYERSRRSFTLADSRTNDSQTGNTCRIRLVVRGPSVCQYNGEVCKMWLPRYGRDNQIHMLTCSNRRFDTFLKYHIWLPLFFDQPQPFEVDLSHVYLAYTEESLRQSLLKLERPRTSKGKLRPKTGRRCVSEFYLTYCVSLFLGKVAGME